MDTQTNQLKEVLARARREVAKVIIGQNEVVDKALIAIFTGYHALIEGVPGVAKTLIVRVLAHVLGCEFARIQFTPDLMPADITGTHVFNLQRNAFTLVKGPVFTTFYWLTKSTVRLPKLNQRYSRRCKSGWSPSIARPIPSLRTSRSSRRRIPSNTKEHIRCLKHKRTDSC